LHKIVSSAVEFKNLTQFLEGEAPIQSAGVRSPKNHSALTSSSVLPATEMKPSEQVFQEQLRSATQVEYQKK
jgi:hypothetical protein